MPQQTQHQRRARPSQSTCWNWLQTCPCSTDRQAGKIAGLITGAVAVCPSLGELQHMAHMQAWNPSIFEGSCPWHHTAAAQGCMTACALHCTAWQAACVPQFPCLSVHTGCTLLHVGWCAHFREVVLQARQVSLSICANSRSAPDTSKIRSCLALKSP